MTQRNNLRRLDRKYLRSTEFLQQYAAHELQGMESFTSEYSREVSIEPLERVLEYALGKFSSIADADGWLAPRVHNALRLSRSEASDSEIWLYLACCSEVTRTYVSSRWVLDTAAKAKKRLAGPIQQQALARLWWGAELFRDGADYSRVVKAFRNQDIPNTLMGTRAVCYRPMAHAMVDVLSVPWGGKSPGSKEVNSLSTWIGYSLAGTVLESFGPDECGAGPGWGEWITESPDAGRIIEETLPSGPSDKPVDPDTYQAVRGFVERTVKSGLELREK